jgi:hypothetical protein
MTIDALPAPVLDVIAKWSLAEPFLVVRTLEHIVSLHFRASNLQFWYVAYSDTFMGAAPFASIAPAAREAMAESPRWRSAKGELAPSIVAVERIRTSVKDAPYASVSIYRRQIRIVLSDTNGPIWFADILLSNRKSKVRQWLERIGKPYRTKSATYPSNEREPRDRRGP